MDSQGWFEPWNSCMGVTICAGDTGPCGKVFSNITEKGVFMIWHKYSGGDLSDT